MQPDIYIRRKNAWFFDEMHDSLQGFGQGQRDSLQGFVAEVIVTGIFFLSVL